MPNRSNRNGTLPTLRRAISARVVALAVLQVALVLALTRWQLLPQLEALQVGLNKVVADNVAASTAQTLKRPVATVAAQANVLSKHGNQNSALTRSVLQSLVDSHTMADSVFILDRDGRVRYLAQSAELTVQGIDRTGLDFSSSELYLVGRSASTTLSPVYLSPVSEKPTVAVSAQLGEDGMLVMELNLERLLAQDHRSELDSGINVLLVDANGYIVADRNASASQRNAMLPIDTLRAVQSQSQNVAVEYEGKTWLASSSLVTLGQLDWRVLVLRSQQALYFPIVRIAMATVVSIAAVMLISYLVLLAFTRRLTRVMEMLNQHAQEFARGAEPSEANMQFQDLAQVDDSMRTMAETLRQREQALRDANEVLEHRVQQRTEHLEKANAELAQTMQQLATTQSDLVQAGKMSALGSMVAGIAHEMNTPVGNARLAATTLKDTAARMNEDLAEGKVSRSQLQASIAMVANGAALIDSSLERAADLVQSFKQVAVDQTSNRRRMFNLQEVVRENEMLLAPRLRRAETRIEVQAPQEKVMLNSYPGALGQVVTNLIENALVHGYGGEKGGTIEVIIDPVAPDLVRMQVRDHGRGIAPESLSRVFDPFFTTRLGQGGSGLGLSIVYGLVTNTLGGRISVESVVGKGATFTLVLPLNGPQQAEEASAHRVPLAN